MELLPLHIEYLLTRHDCVIVPGIGALIACEKDALIDMERGVVSPRRREISFNSSVVTDDGLLSHSIALREKLTYEEAHRLLDRLTGKMAYDLRNEGEVSLGRIGRLVSDADGLISFQPRKSIIGSDILTDAPLRMKKEVSKADATSEAVPAAAIKTAEPTRFRHMRTIEVPEDRYVFTVSRKVAHAAAMLVMLLTVSLAFLMPVSHDEQQKASVVPMEEFLRRPLVIETSEDTAIEVDSVATIASPGGLNTAEAEKNE